MKRLCLCACVVGLFYLLGVALAADTYMATKVGTLTIDGDLSDWGQTESIVLGEESWEANGGSWDNPADLTMRLMICWNDDGLFIASEVQDEAHINTKDGAGIWNGDCVQYMIDPTGNRTDTTNVVYEFGFALAGPNSDTPMSTRWLSNSAAPANFEADFAIVRDDAAGTTTYEVFLPVEQIAPAKLAEGAVLGFGAIVNDGDPGAEGQAGWVGWGSHAIVFGKDATELKELILTGAPSAVDPSDKLSTQWARLKF